MNFLSAAFIIILMIFLLKLSVRIFNDYINPASFLTLYWLILMILPFIFTPNLYFSFTAFLWVVSSIGFWVLGSALSLKIRFQFYKSDFSSLFHNPIFGKIIFSCIVFAGVCGLLVCFNMFFSLGGSIYLFGDEEEK